MTCIEQDRNGAELLVDFCAGILDAARVARLEEHMAGCAGCRRLVEEQRRVWESLEEWKAVEVSPDFDAKLYARIAQERQAPWWKRLLVPVWKPLLPLAAAGAVLSLALVVRMPDATLSDSSKQVRLEKISVEQVDQVEQALDDLDILAPM